MFLKILLRHLPETNTIKLSAKHVKSIRYFIIYTLNMAVP